MKGRIYQTGGGSYLVRLEAGSFIRASLRGKLKRAPSLEPNQVVVGDMVDLARSGRSWTIESVRVRETKLVRRGPGGRTGKLLAANVDTALAVVSVREPSATLALADRLLVLAEACGLRPVVVVNKIDLAGGRDIARRFTKLYSKVGYPVLTVSALYRLGIDELAEEMADRTSTLIGPTGVGKSSLLNAIDPQIVRRTGEVSKRGTGRHTTVRSCLIALPGGGLVVDTPGFGDIQAWGIGPHEVARCFPEVVAAAPSCRFRGCAHLDEPECAVRDALFQGRMAESRYRSYVTARREAGTLNHWQVAAR